MKRGEEVTRGLRAADHAVPVEDVVGHLHLQGTAAALHAADGGSEQERGDKTTVSCARTDRALQCGAARVPLLTW